MLLLKISKILHGHGLVLILFTESLLGDTMGNLFRKGPTTVDDIIRSGEVSLAEIERWKGDFQRTSRGKDFFTERDFVESYRKTFACGDARAFAKNLFRVMDTDGNGVVDLREFLIGLSSSTGDNVRKKIKWAFSMYDSNGDGYISRKELYSIIKSIFKMYEGNVREGSDIDRLVHDTMRTMDANGDSKISLREFEQGVRKNKWLLDILDY